MSLHSFPKSPIVMRRKEKERTDKEFIADVLTRANELYVAFATEGAPYVVPLNFVFADNKLYIHCATSGYKLDCLKKNPQVGFTAVVDMQIKTQEATTHFKSIVGTGYMSLVDDAKEKAFALDALSTRFQSSCPVPTPPEIIAKTGVLCIDIETICGKQAPASASQ